MAATPPPFDPGNEGTETGMPPSERRSRQQERAWIGLAAMLLTAVLVALVLFVL